MGCAGSKDAVAVKGAGGQADAPAKGEGVGGAREVKQSVEEQIKAGYKAGSPPAQETSRELPPRKATRSPEPGPADEGGARQEGADEPGGGGKAGAKNKGGDEDSASLTSFQLQDDLLDSPGVMSKDVKGRAGVEEGQAGVEDVQVELDFLDGLKAGDEDGFDPELLEKVSKAVDVVISAPTARPSLDGHPPSTGEVVKAAPQLSTKLETYGEVQQAVAIHQHAKDKVKEMEGKLRPASKGKRDVITIYMTSVRAIRKTHEDCARVRQVFLNLGAQVDEKDVSMDTSFREELKARMKGVPTPVPRVFVGDNDLGGIREIDEMTEEGSLKQLLVELGYLDERRAATFMCDACGNVKFVLCTTCTGSHRIVVGADVVMCKDCNENGLRRCPACTVG